MRAEALQPSGTAPDGIVPLVGYREWAVSRDEAAALRLRSLFHPTVWPADRPLTAVCLRPLICHARTGTGHAGVPDVLCECGSYAFRDPRFDTLRGAKGPKVRGTFRLCCDLLHPPDSLGPPDRVSASRGRVGATATAGQGSAPMILVRHVMTEAPKSLSPERAVADAAGLMELYDVGIIPLASADGSLVGVVTDRDLVLRVLAKRRDPGEVTLGEVATTNLVTISPDENIAGARDLMSEHRIRRLPVVKDGQLVGIVSLGDIAVSDASKRAVGEVLEDVSESPSTSEIRTEPDRGTPDRVREARRRPRVS